jgi:hypothetical protein
MHWPCLPNRRNADVRKSEDARFSRGFAGIARIMKPLSGRISAVIEEGFPVIAVHIDAGETTMSNPESKL